MDVKNKVTIITGAASGIGRASARAFAKAGAKVMVTDINGEGAKAVAAEIGGETCTCDVGKEAAINEVVAITERKLGPVDIFFSNAAVLTGADPLSTPLQQFETQWQVNAMAHVYAVRAVLPAMLERGSGYLIHTASMAGYLTSVGNLPYAMTKHAVVGLAEWLSITYHARGVRISLLAPAGVRTPMLAAFNPGLQDLVVGPTSEPETVAEQVLDAVAEERFLILTDPGAQALLERKTNDLERWLKGMRRMQAKVDDINSKKS